MRTSEYSVLLIAMVSMTCTVDVRSQGADEAKQLAEAALRERLGDMNAPSWADSLDVEVEAVNVAPLGADEVGEADVEKTA